MGLINQGPSFAYWSDNLGTFTSGTSYGTAHDPGVNAGTPADSTPGTILSALAHDCEYLILGFSGFGRSAVNTATFLDVLYDPAGGTAWSQVIGDLIIGHSGSVIDLTTASATTLGISLAYHFPIWLPSGSSIGVRAKTISASPYPASPRIIAYAAGGCRNPASWWCGQKVETVGTLNQNTCRGQSITPGANGGMGSWTDLGSPLSTAGGSVQYGCQGQSGSAWVSEAYRLEFGAGNSMIGPAHWFGATSGENLGRLLPGPVFYDFPAGVQLQARLGSSAASPVNCDVAAYVVQ